MDPRMIRIEEKRRHGVAAVPGIGSAGSEPDIQRVRRAFADRYTVVKSLRSDSEIERYLARDLRGGTVQLNVLPAKDTNNILAREFFYRSAHAASKLSHVNIIDTGAAQEERGVDFFLVEHKPDATPLGELLDRNGWLDLKLAANVADQIASALDYAHQTGVLHLSIQPECILIEPDGWVTVAEFGIEEKHMSLRPRGPAPQYSSPEQLTDGPVDRRSDLYSLGAVLYEMLTDRTPYDSTDAEYVRRKQASFTPSPPHLISMDVSESVSNVVMKLLERGPARRFDTASAFQTALDDVVNY